MPMTERLSAHFFLEELLVSDTAEQRGIPNKPTPAHLEHIEKYLVPGLELCRTILGNRSMVITSAYRNPEINKIVGGTPTSAHPQGFAADFRVAGLTCYAVYRLLRSAQIDQRVKFDQLILESGRNIVHASFDPRYRKMAGHQPGAAGTKIDWTYK